MIRTEPRLRILAVTNIYPTPADPSEGTSIQEQLKGLEAAGLDVRVLYFERSRAGVSIYRTVRRRVADAVGSQDPHLIQVMYGGVLADLVTRAVRKPPIIVSFLGSDLFGAPGANVLKRAMGRYGVFASHRAARRAAGVIVQSSGLRDALGPSADPSAVWILPAGVDLNKFQPMERELCRQRLGWSPDRFYILFGGRKWNPVKRIGLAAAAVDRLRRSGLLVEFTSMERVPHTEVPIWLNAGDVLILTSRHEGSPVIVKEALACDRPVVSVDVGDVAERIRGLEGCYLGRPDPDDLAAGLRIALSARGTERGARRAAVQDFSLLKVSEKLIEIYRTVLDGRLRKRG